MTDTHWDSLGSRIFTASNRGKEATPGFHSALVGEAEEGGGWVVLLVGRCSREVKGKE